MTEHANRLTAFRAFREGLTSAWICRRLLFPLYLLNLLTALFAVLPLYLALHRLTAHRPLAEVLLHRWDLEVLVELVMDHPALVAQIKGIFVFVPVVYLALSQLLLGGVLGALAKRGLPTARRFGRHALTHLPGLAWVLLWSAIPYAISVAILGAGYLVAESATWPVIVLALVPGLICLLWTDIALDLARAATVVGGVRPSVKRVLYGFWAVLRRPRACVFIHVGYGLTSWVFVAGLLLLPDGLDAGGSWALLGAFLIRQVVFFLRVGWRVASLGSHLALYRDIFPSTAGERHL